MSNVNPKQLTLVASMVLKTPSSFLKKKKTKNKKQKNKKTSEIIMKVICDFYTCKVSQRLSFN